MLVAIIVGVLSSLLASLIFLFFLRLMRPKIVISDKIAKTGDRFVIKVVNKSRRDAVDIKVEFLLMTPVSVPNGIILRRRPILLKRDYLMVLPRYDKRDKDASYAFRFTTQENLLEIWNKEHQYLLFRLMAKDELSGFGKVFNQKFYTKKDIMEGSFEFGESLEIR